MTTTLIFMDTETTGLNPDDDIWEFAAIRRHPDGHEERLHLFIEHDHTKCARLPGLFAIDHKKRFPAACSGKITTKAQAARLIADFTAHREGEPAPHVVGAVPNFDTERVTRLLAAGLPANYHREPGWHYHLIDVENLAVGYLAARGHAPAPPWDSDTLSTLAGIGPQADGTRHTAMGDATWVRDLYDHIMNAADLVGGQGEDEGGEAQEDEPASEEDPEWPTAPLIHATATLKETGKTWTGVLARDRDGDYVRPGDGEIVPGWYYTDPDYFTLTDVTELTLVPTRELGELLQYTRMLDGAHPDRAPDIHKWIAETAGDLTAQLSLLDLHPGTTGDPR